MSRKEAFMSETLRGIVHGRTIEVDRDPGLADGTTVEVELHVPEPERKPGDGIRRSAGALAHLPPEDWEALEAIIRERKSDKRPPIE
jgi:hypothetical protein